jgi:hypothetical protein
MKLSTGLAFLALSALCGSGVAQLRSPVRRLDALDDCEVRDQDERSLLNVRRRGEGDLAT